MLIITVVYVPILALQGIEGKMFKPMAVVVMLALGGSLVLALTLMPVLCTLLLGGRIREADNWLVAGAKRIYTPLLYFGLRFRWGVVLPILALFDFSLGLFSRMGAEFIPQLDEGDLTFQLIRSSSAGLNSSLELQKQSEAVLRREFPAEVEDIFSRIGTAEIATDPRGTERRGYLHHAPAAQNVADDRRPPHEQGRAGGAHADGSDRTYPRIEHTRLAANSDALQRDHGQCSR